MWVQATTLPAGSRKSVRRRAQTRRQPTTRVVPTTSEPTSIGREHRHLGGADQPGQATLGVPGPIEAARRRVDTRRRPARSAAGPTSAASRPVRPRRSGRDTALTRRPGSRPRQRAGSGEVVERLERRSVAVRVVRRRLAIEADLARARGIEDDEGDRSRSSSSAAWVRASSSWWRTSALMPRAPHLQS